MQNLTVFIEMNDRKTTYMLNDVTGVSLTDTHLVLRYGEHSRDYSGEKLRVPFTEFHKHWIIDNKEDDTCHH